MRLPRLRFPVRRMMVAVAIVGLAFGLWRRRESFLEKSRQNTGAATLHPCRLPPEAGTDEYPQWQEEEEMIRRRDDHLLRLAAKYERAARYPWLPVAPDQPEPK